MSQHHPDLTLGTPRFDDRDVAETAREHGDAAAWKEALVHSPSNAAAMARGDFAIGLQDASNRSFAAVDRFGIQTLCYADTSTGVKFAERADALAKSPDDIDPQAILEYLYFHVIPSPRTIYHGVHRLQPGNFLNQTSTGATAEPYWQPTFKAINRSFEEKRSLFLQLLESAVQRQLDGSPAACFLSGGTDSSTLAGIIRRVTGEPPETYSIGFAAEGYDEMEYARMASRHFGTNHHEHYITPDDVLELIPIIAAAQDQPFGNSSVVPAYFCALKARADGVSKLLAGDGGDELFGGNSRYATQTVLSWYQSVPAQLRRGLLEPLARAGLLDSVPLIRKGMSYVRQASVPMPGRLQTYNLMTRIGAKELLTPLFLKNVNLDGPMDHEARVWRTSAGNTLINRMLAFDWRYTLAENDLPKVRCATELAGVKAAYPFLDLDIVDFAASLTDADKLKHLKLRWFFKEALRGFLPDDIITKKKHGFGLPFGTWALTHAGLKALATDTVRSLGTRGIVRSDFADLLMRQHLPQHPGYYGSLVWILMMLELWFRNHAPNYQALE